MRIDVVGACVGSGKFEQTQGASDGAMCQIMTDYLVEAFY